MIKKTTKGESFDSNLYYQNNEDYISLTDMVRSGNAERANTIIQNWFRTRNAIEFCGLWEQINNQKFKLDEFEAFKNEAGSNSFTLTPQKWSKATNAIGIIAKSGSYGGIFAHRDIAFEFAIWLSPKFKLYLIKESQRLKSNECDRLNVNWNLQKTFTQINYHIHSNAIKKNLLPAELTTKQINFEYADEADILNVAIFGKTAQEWLIENPDSEENLHDQSTINQLIVLSNLESINTLLLRQGVPQRERLIQLNKMAISQMQSLLNQ